LVRRTSSQRFGSSAITSEVIVDTTDCRENGGMTEQEVGAIESVSSEQSFGPSLRAWRQYRRVSQLELGLTAEISQRHISWLENGRSQPSRGMVVKLSEALDVPLRERNRLLNAAGFTSLYRERGLDEEQMQAVRSALDKMLEQHMPYPSVVVDPGWNLLAANACAEALVEGVAPSSFWEEFSTDGRKNLMLLTLHPKGLQPLIANWDEVSHAFSVRLRQDIEQATDSDHREHLRSLLDLIDEPTGSPTVPHAPLMPMLSIDIRFGDEVLRLFSVISTFGTAQDVTADELRIESFFPVDSTSDAILRRLAETPSS